MAEKKMLTAAKVAEELGVSVGKVKKAIEKAGVAADEVKRNCSYYGTETIKKIKKALD